jgi:hypothetical protein
MIFSLLIFEVNPLSAQSFSAGYECMSIALHPFILNVGIGIIHQLFRKPEVF